MRIQHCKKDGFSLLETLFVIVILAVFVIIGVKWTNSETDEIKAKAAANEMHIWLEIALNYFDIKTQWPSDAATLLSHYPNVVKSTNPWGNPYITEIIGPDQGNFAVKTVLPTPQLATRVKSLLGLGEIVNGDTVIAYAGSAVNPNLNKNIIIKDIGSLEGENSGLGNWDSSAGDAPGGDSFNLRSDAKISQSKLMQSGRIFIRHPLCPAGMKPQIQVMLSGFQKGCLQMQNILTGNWSCTDLNNFIPVKTAFTVFVQPLKIQETNDGWEYWVETKGDSPVWWSQRDLPNYHGSLTYMTYCQGIARN